jgi:hypothetical protein
MVRLEKTSPKKVVREKTMAKKMKRFTVAYSTPLGHEGSMTVEAGNNKEAEQIARGRIRVQRIHSITGM